MFLEVFDFQLQDPKLFQHVFVMFERIQALAPDLRKEY